MQVVNSKRYGIKILEIQCNNYSTIAILLGILHMTGKVNMKK